MQCNAQKLLIKGMVHPVNQKGKYKISFKYNFSTQENDLAGHILYPDDRILHNYHIDCATCYAGQWFPNPLALGSFIAVGEPD